MGFKICCLGVGIENRYYLYEEAEIAGARDMVVEKVVLFFRVLSYFAIIHT